MTTNSEDRQGQGAAEGTALWAVGGLSDSTLLYEEAGGEIRHLQPAHLRGSIAALDVALARGHKMDTSDAASA